MEMRSTMLRDTSLLGKSGVEIRCQSKSGVSSSFRAREIRCQAREIRCQFIFSGKDDELTPDFLVFGQG